MGLKLEEGDMESNLEIWDENLFFAAKNDPVEIVHLLQDHKHGATLVQDEQHVPLEQLHALVELEESGKTVALQDIFSKRAIS